MADLVVVPVALSGFPGGPGTNTFHFRQGVDDFTALHDFYGVMLGLIPDSVSIHVPTSGPVVDEVTGDLISSWFIDDTGTMTGSNTTAYAGGVGATVRWETADVVNSRHVRGHTFLVPLYGGMFDVNGTLKETERTIILGAAGDLLTAYGTDLVVWHRPVARAGGSAHTVTGYGVSDRAAWLSSRRG